MFFKKWASYTNKGVIKLVIYHVRFRESNNVQLSNEKRKLFQHIFRLNYPFIIKLIRKTCSEPQTLRSTVSEVIHTVYCYSNSNCSKTIYPIKLLPRDQKTFSFNTTKSANRTFMTVIHVPYDVGCWYEIETIQLKWIT